MELILWREYGSVVYNLLLALASTVTLRSESRGIHDHILLSLIRDSSNLQGQIAVFLSPRNRVARLYPQALGSFLVTSYDSQGYGGGIRPRLHSGYSVTYESNSRRHGAVDSQQ
jgi:hypothetical protein